MLSPPGRPLPSRDPGSGAEPLHPWAWALSPGCGWLRGAPQPWEFAGDLREGFEKDAATLWEKCAKILTKICCLCRLASCGSCHKAVGEPQQLACGGEKSCGYPGAGTPGWEPPAESWGRTRTLAMKCGLELGLKSVCALWYVGRKVVKSWLLKDMELPLHEHCFCLPLEEAVTWYFSPCFRQASRFPFRAVPTSFWQFEQQ